MDEKKKREIRDRQLGNDIHIRDEVLVVICKGMGAFSHISSLRLPLRPLRPSPLRLFN